MDTKKSDIRSDIVRRGRLILHFKLLLHLQQHLLHPGQLGLLLLELLVRLVAAAFWLFKLLFNKKRVEK